MLLPRVDQMMLLVDHTELRAICSEAIEGYHHFVLHMHEVTCAKLREKAAKPSWVRRLLHLPPPKVPCDATLLREALANKFEEPIKSHLIEMEEANDTLRDAQMFQGVSRLKTNVPISLGTLARLRTMGTWRPKTATTYRTTN